MNKNRQTYALSEVIPAPAPSQAVQKPEETKQRKDSTSSKEAARFNAVTQNSSFNRHDVSTLSQTYVDAYKSPVKQNSENAFMPMQPSTDAFDIMDEEEIDIDEMINADKKCRVLEIKKGSNILMKDKEPENPVQVREETKVQ